MQPSRIISGMLILLVFASCDSKMVYEQNIDFKNEAWHRDSLLYFDVTISDTISLHNIYINSRITGQYEYSNLFLFINSELPNGTRITDTLECILATPDGKWLGKGFGHIWSNQVAYRKNIRFKQAGHYHFMIEQAMRTDELPYVLDAGIRIEKIK